MTWVLSDMWTLVLALGTVLLGRGLNRLLPWLERGNIPPAISAGLLLSGLLAWARAQGWVDVQLSTGARDVLLLLFFASVGFGAHLGRLWAVGKNALVMCLAIVLAVVLQNVAGVLVAHSMGEPSALGLFMGSMAYLGGHGTAAAWAQTPQALSLPGAFEVGIGSATLGLVLGGLVAGPVAAWLARRSTTPQPGGASTPDASPAEATRSVLSAFESDRWLLPLLILLVCVAAGPWVAQQVGHWGFQMPHFLAVLLLGVVLTNVADGVRHPLDTQASDLVGTVALRMFLAMAMLTLDWSQLSSRWVLLVVGAVTQVGVTVLIAVGVVYVLFGRDRDGAVASGGFIGFGLGAMPIGLAVMRRLNTHFGDTPRALLAVTLAASLFTDTANAVLLSLFFRWLG